MSFPSSVATAVSRKGVHRLLVHEREAEEHDCGDDTTKAEAPLMAVAAVVATATIKAACGRDLIFRTSSIFVLLL